MSKILKPNECGFGILIESDAGYISSDLNPNILKENFEIKLNEPVLIKCILQKYGVKNRNGRIYPKEVLLPQVEIYRQLVENNSGVGECFTPNTKILTKDGWKLIKNISDDEYVLTLNKTTNKTEYQKITKKINDDYSGIMYHIKSTNVDIQVTPNHRFLLLDRNNKMIEIRAFELLDDTNNTYFNGKYKLIKKFNYDYETTTSYTFSNLTIPSELFYSFMGIYLSEGCVTKNSKIQITQKKEDNVILIENLLNDIGFDYKKQIRSTNTVDFYIDNFDLYNYLLPLGKSFEKYIPKELKNNSSIYLEQLFNWFLIGDGRNVDFLDRKSLLKNRKSVFSTSKKLIYDLNEILLKIGKSGNITIDTKRNDRIINDIYLDENNVEIKKPRIISRKNSKALFNLNVSKTEHIYLDRRTISVEKVNYSGKIVCVKVPNETIYVMRNGKSFWSLNSDHPESSVISLQNISHLITKMWWGKGEDENVLYGELKLIVTPGFIKYGVVSVVGDKILLYLQNKVKIGISSRGVGSLKQINGENIVQSDFELIGFDLVSTPSTPGAFLMYPSTTNEPTQIKESEDKLIKTINQFLL